MRERAGASAQDVQPCAQVCACLHVCVDLSVGLRAGAGAGVGEHAHMYARAWCCMVQRDWPGVRKLKDGTVDALLA